MDYQTIFTILFDLALLYPYLRALFPFVTKMAIALWPLVSSYLSFVAAFAADKNFVVAVVSWLSLLRYWKPWAAATADLREEVDLAIDLVFLVWFLMGVPIIVMTIWFGLMGVLRLAGNEIVRRIHDAMDFEIDLTDYIVKCYSPMTPGSTGDRIMALQLAAQKYDKELVWQRTPSHLYLYLLDRHRPDPIFGRRPRRAVKEPSFTDEQLRAQKEFKKVVMERARQVLAARKNGGTTVEQPVIDLKPTTSDIEEHAPAAPSVPQPRETQSSAWPTDPESEKVTDDVTIANGPIETEEPADRTQSRGEGLVGPSPKAPEPEASSGVEGNGLLEGDEDSRAEEPESSHEQEGESSAEEPKSSSGEEGEGLAEELESSSEEDGEGPLYKVDTANDLEISFEVEGEVPLSTATVPEAAQEPESSYEEEGESLLNIDTAPAEEPDTSMEVDGEGWSTMAPVPESSSDDGLPVAGGNMDETSHGVESDVEMADAEPLAGMAVPRPSYDLCMDVSNSQETILPLEVAAAWPLAGQEPVSCDDTRGWLDVSPALQSAQNVVEAQ
ncbi:hypothetical protein TGAM01_v210589 [Trichoderma gamsii]|uniref:Uncharacterized protein n=1 Tax=Trichoderma gamsii TaxID=398673 RepID=A0A2P4Z8D7_9HYPO|nr:hypothetical protein TGAM01_v210589 [Trichoderma gamsii]PON20555.1 hypothetical protein TGAM01_v210589 [Trichoderma gamsii]